MDLGIQGLMHWTVNPERLYATGSLFRDPGLLKGQPISVTPFSLQGPLVGRYQRDFHRHLQDPALALRLHL